jgi:hypothetical protein
LIIQGFDQRVELELGVAQQDGAEVDELHVEAPVGEMPLERLETQGKALVERGDGHVTRGAQKGEADVTPLAEVKDAGG